VDRQFARPLEQNKFEVSGSNFGSVQVFRSTKLMKILRPAISPLASVARALAVALVLLFCAAPSFAAPVHLRVDQRVDPLGIDSAAPTLSWQSDSTDRNWTQSAYRILLPARPPRCEPNMQMCGTAGSKRHLSR